MNQSQHKIKVCCFCEQWESGGIESFLTNVLQHLDLKKFQVDIVAASLKPSVFTKPLQEIGVRFYELSGNQKKIIRNHKLFFLLLKREQYDVVHLNVFQGLSLYYVKLAERAGIPVRIIHSHNSDLRKSPTKPIKLLLHRICKSIYSNSATDFWACSSLAAEFMFPKDILNERNFFFVPNGIETERFRFDMERRNEVRKKLGIEKKYVVGNIGRLCYQKNQDFLLEIFSEIKKRKAESYLLIVGEGECLKSLQQKAHRLGIEDSVTFYGVTSHVEELLWAMDVFVFPSRFEGFGIAVIEAAAAGLPVVVSTAVPKEVLIDDSVQPLFLESGKEKWAKHVLSLPLTFKRECSAQKVEKAGFDIIVVAKSIANKIEGGPF